MSELEKTAPNEIYLIVGDTDKDCNFNELSEVTWADLPIYEETAIKYIKSYQLTIPKRIADELEEYDAGKKGNYSLFSLSEKAREFYLSHNDIVTIYFASKALGVDLVKVVEND